MLVCADPAYPYPHEPRAAEELDVSAHACDATLEPVRERPRNPSSVAS
jgi:hypothetical protein